VRPADPSPGMYNEALGEEPLTEPTIPEVRKADVTTIPRDHTRRLNLVTAAAVLALGVAGAAWFVMSRQIDDLRGELATLQDAHRELALQVGQGRKGDPAAGQVIDVVGAPALGPAQATVTLVEFSDYECPFCIRHFHTTMPLIDQNYVKPGKIRYVFRDFPIDQNHPQAIKAHEAARCALEQNKFWNLHPRLFSAPGTHTEATLDARAKDAGLDEQAFRACIASGRTTKAIRATASIADSLGATGTPWFFVGIRDIKTDKVRVLKAIGGAQPYEQFATALDAALKNAGTP
jgi:protein-disulfide isomerase